MVRGALAAIAQLDARSERAHAAPAHDGVSGGHTPVNTHGVGVPQRPQLLRYIYYMCKSSLNMILDFFKCSSSIVHIMHDMRARVCV